MLRARRLPAFPIFGDMPTVLPGNGMLIEENVVLPDALSVRKALITAPVLASREHLCWMWRHRVSLDVGDTTGSLFPNQPASTSSSHHQRQLFAAFVAVYAGYARIGRAAIHCSFLDLPCCRHSHVWGGPLVLVPSTGIQSAVTTKYRPTISLCCTRRHFCPSYQVTR